MLQYILYSVCCALQCDIMGRVLSALQERERGVCACATPERGAAGVFDTMERGDTGVT